MDSPDPVRTAERVLRLARDRAPTLGGSRLVCIDGPAGSGKTTLAAAIAALTPEAVVVHTDDLLEGWHGLPTLDQQLDPLLVPLADGEPGSYPRYDWLADRFAETVTVPPTPLLVVEGVGSGARRHRASCTVLVWVEVDPAIRLLRGLARDGQQMREHWEQWMREEQVLFADEGTREHADVVV